MLRLVREFYRQPFAWLLLVVTDLTLVYGGGAAMFWYHSYFLGEGGPAISPYLHWFVDSTAGLVGLTPMLFLILPIAARAAWDASPARAQGTTEDSAAAGDSGSTAKPVLRNVRPVSFMAVGGILFALATAPGPIVHDNLVGRGTWLAAEITKLWGNGRPLPATHHLTPMTAILTQEAFGLPLYPALLGLLLIAGSALFRSLNRRAAEAVDRPMVSADRG